MKLLPAPGAPGWRAAAAVAQGESHRRRDDPCQDAVAYRRGPDDTLLFALADGAGSAPQAELGAQTAVAAALDALEAGLLTGERGAALIAVTFAEAVRALDDLALAGACARAEFAATLIAGVAAPDGLALGQVGDGLVVARGDGGDLCALTQPVRGEYANETVFLTSPTALASLQVVVRPGPIPALAVMSDGLLRLAVQLPQGDPFAPFFGPLFAFAAAIQDETQAGRDLAAFLASPRVAERSDDDRALFLAARYG
jgi:hypothetical protein